MNHTITEEESGTILVNVPNENIDINFWYPSTNIGSMDFLLEDIQKATESKEIDLSIDFEPLIAKYPYEYTTSTNKSFNCNVESKTEIKIEVLESYITVEVNNFVYKKSLFIVPKDIDIEVLYLYVKLVFMATVK